MFTFISLLLVRVLYVLMAFDACRSRLVFHAVCQQFVSLITFVRGLLPRGLRFGGLMRVYD